MARQSSVTFEQNFSNGLITQATGLNFPENACTETYNCIFKETGLVSRRPQFDFEDNYITEAFNREGKAINTFLWKGASSSGDFSIVVVQIGTDLFFYDSEGGESLSQRFFSSSSIDMSSYVTGLNPELQECTFAVGLGYLFVFHPGIEPLYVSYDPILRSFSADSITIQIRDTKGVTDSAAVGERPTGSITAAHHYNLLNQGWGAALNGTSPYTAWDTARSDWPSNADVWWDFKDETDTFNLDYVDSVSRGSTPSPKGYYILDLFDQQRDTVSGVSGITDVTYDSRPAVGSFFAGRVWYTNISESDLANKIFFSQIIEDTSKFGKCYQNGDPTAEFDSVLLATDGGFITIPDVGLIYRLEPLGNHLIVFASNGVWSITGSEGIGFTATDYTITYLSEVKSISNTSFVKVENSILWWNLDGVYVLQPAQGGAFAVQNISNQRIKDFFATIPVICKRQARGSYNSLTNVVQWLYRTTVNDTFDEIYEFDAVLNLNMLSGAFYPWTISVSGDVKVAGIITANVSGQSRLQAFKVIDGSSDLVIDGAGNQVVAYNYSAFSSAITTTKFLCGYGALSSENLTWAEVAVFTPPNDYLDWYKYDSTGIDYDSYFISGYKLRGQGAAKFQANYLNVFSYTERESPVEFYVQGRWDYALLGDTGKWTNTQKISLPTSDYSYQRRRLKIRGRGVTVQFKFSSVPGQPFNVGGWSVWETTAMGV